MKGNDEVIQEFNEVVNMTASELEKWLKSDDSNSAGWPKEDEDGETVGHDSGRKIVEILKENPKKEPENKRHLAQETKANNDKSPEEVKKTKSYASLKNWGHDFLKAQGKENGSEKKEEKEDREEANDDAEEAEEEEGDDDGEKQTGEKRRATRSQTGSNKKRETRKGESAKSNDEEEEEDEEEEDGEDEKKQGQKKQSNGQSKKSNGSSKKDEDTEVEQDDDEGGDDSGTKKGPKKGDTVSWNWGQGQPKGKVLDVKAEDTTITTKNGNEVSRKGDEEDPAVVLDTGKNKAIKKAHELN
ncbi:hypothetical protein FGADI_9980 [Fusarium gaditjirri]|uniref:Hypervirulence associated protein TUDOR domain-containing protein n=1 Tax=Fusarium gaditjirri TaxID=282569 RepID=A0A8H4SYJ5_9HYPO|nr:hypothetical protein FGADI_9980 [Fusarium gaditjirri]